MGFVKELIRGIFGPVPPQPHTQLDQGVLSTMEEAGYEAVFYKDGRFSHYAKRSLFIKNVAEHEPRRK